MIESYLDLNRKLTLIVCCLLHFVGYAITI